MRRGLIVTSLVASLFFAGCGTDDVETPKTPEQRQAEQESEYVIYRGEYLVEFKTYTPAKIIDRVASDVCGFYALSLSNDYYSESRLLVTCST